MAKTKTIRADQMVRAASRNVFMGKVKAVKVIPNKKRKAPRYRKVEEE